MNGSTEHSGSCSCGFVKYSINEDPLFTQACHCDDCKKSTGSAFVISSMILESCFEIEEGELHATTLPTGSGSGYKPFFCKKCGTYIYCEYERAPGIILIRTSSLDEAQNFPPQAHVFTKSKVDWIHLDDNIPSFEIWYDRDELWPQASLDRLSGLF